MVHKHKYLIYAISLQAVEFQEMTRKFCVERDLGNLNRKICNIGFTGLPTFKCVIYLKLI